MRFDRKRSIIREDLFARLLISIGSQILLFRFFNFQNITELYLLIEFTRNVVLFMALFIVAGNREKKRINKWQKNMLLEASSQCRFFIKKKKKRKKNVTTMRLSRITFYNHGEDKSKIAGESKAGILLRKIRSRIETIIINLIKNESHFEEKSQ